MRQQNEWWTEVALKVFARHKSEDGVYPPDYDDMQKVNDEVDRLDKQYHIRISGENGYIEGHSCGLTISHLQALQQL